MFGIIRPCRHRLGREMLGAWTAHLCGLCLALRTDHGQFARLVTHYDGLVVSVLAEAQSAAARRARRTAGPCPLRGMRTASVAHGEGARLAASVSLVLASAKTRDHVADGDGMLARRPFAAAARRVAGSWERAAARTGASLGFDTAPLVDAVDRQPLLEAAARPGGELLAVTEPAETAAAAAFGHTAVLAGRPHNTAPLSEAGRFFGRLAHLLDAVEDLTADEAAGAWNPIAVTGTAPSEVRRLCDDAVHGIRLALREVDFADGRLAHLLLAHETRRSVDRAFGAACRHDVSRHGGGSPYEQGGGSPYGHGGGPHDAGGGRLPPRGFLGGCGAFLGLCCTCRMCCAEEYEGPWSRKRREGCCHKADCDCCSACSCDC